ncbi:MAG TPA: asparagine synthase (glutamine-hydrolyzing) [Chitinophagaceae bacterium]|nr:asparagine synthase (glutamine-hydrolyzing) [Chitinophagaceae bacterium]
MCGIAGIIQSNPFYKQPQLLKMTDALAHRGPDGSANWQNSSGHVLFGHRRLAIIDLSPFAAQPMQYRDRYTIIHNGEIYNYIELKEELEKKGHSFHTKSDTEVILAAYAEWGADCTEQFDGMFAFAIWDETEQTLFAARDRFGEKPFFYSFDGQYFLFASEIKALWAAGIPRQLNLQLLFNFITIGYTDNPARPGETFYTNIQKLPAASQLYYSPAVKQPVIEKYWDLDTTYSNKKINDKLAIETFDQLLRDSVKRRLRSDVAIGSSLSGGLDSSSLLALVHQLRESSPVKNEKLKSFTAVFPGYRKDEGHLAKHVSEHFGLQNYTTTVRADDLVNDWEKLCRHQDEPFGSASIYIQNKVYQLAREQDVKVILDGQGADETLAGYHKYFKWYWQELFIKRKLVRSGELKAAHDLGITEQFGLKNIIASLFPDLASVILERQYLFKALRHEDLTREFIQEQSREAYYTTPDYFTLNGALYFNTCIHGLEELLRYADRNSMAHGREVRLPFLSHELVEFIFSLPAHFKIRQGRTKWILRRSMKEILPPDITWRKDKTGFEPPQQEWMQHPRLQEAIREARKKLVKEKILKAETLGKPILALDSHTAGNYDWRYLSAAAYL